MNRYATSTGLASYNVSSANSYITVSTSTTAATLTFVTSSFGSNAFNSTAFLATSTGLTTANFATTSISQWNNDAGYLALAPATTSINGTQAAAFYLVGTAGQISSTVSGATTTFALASTSVTAGSCTYCGLTVDGYGRVTAQSSGSPVTSINGTAGAYTLYNGGILTIATGTASTTITLTTSTLNTQVAALGFVTSTGSSSQWTTTSTGIYYNSNVGIGTTTPGSVLSVGGGLYVSGNVTTTNLSITSLAGASGCLSVSSSGAVATSTCSGGVTTPGGSDTWVQFNNNNAFGGNQYFTFTSSTGLLAISSSSGGLVLGTSTAATNALLTIGTTTNIMTVLNNGSVGINGPTTITSSSTSALAVQDGSGNNVMTVDTTQSSTGSGIDITATGGQTSNLLNFYSSSGVPLAFFNANANLFLGASSSQQGQLTFYNSANTNAVTFQPSTSTAASYTLTLPTSTGSAGQALVTDSSGNLSWGTAGGGGIASTTPWTVGNLAIVSSSGMLATESTSTLWTALGGITTSTYNASITIATAGLLSGGASLTNGSTIALSFTGNNVSTSTANSWTALQTFTVGISSTMETITSSSITNLFVASGTFTSSTITSLYGATGTFTSSLSSTLVSFGTASGTTVSAATGTFTSSVSTTLIKFATASGTTVNAATGTFQSSVSSTLISFATASGTTLNAATGTFQSSVSSTLISFGTASGTSAMFASSTIANLYAASGTFTSLFASTGTFTSSTITNLYVSSGTFVSSTFASLFASTGTFTSTTITTLNGATGTFTSSVSTTLVSFTTASGTTLKAATGTFTSSLSIGTTTNVSGALLTVGTSTNVLTILANGNMGVGTTSPGSLLTVNGSLQVVGNATTTNLTITGLANAQGCLTVSVSGSVGTTTCSGVGSTPGGSNTYVQYNNNGGFNGDPYFTFTSSTDLLAVGSSTGGLVIGTSSKATGALLTIGTSSNIFDVLTNGVVRIGGASASNGQLMFQNSSNTNTVTIQPSTSTSASYVLTLPTSTPTQSGEVLISNTTGNLSWASMAFLVNASTTGNLAISTSGVGYTDVVSSTITVSNGIDSIWITANLTASSTGGTKGFVASTVSTNIYRGTSCNGGTKVGNSVTTTATLSTTTASISYDIAFNSVDISPGAGSQTYSVCAEVFPGATTTITFGEITLEEVRYSGTDLAEVYYAEPNTPLAAGDLVSADPSLPAGVQQSSVPYDNTLLGVISTQPGSVLGAGPGTGVPELVALTGRVPVMVTNDNGDIHAGDYLTSSDLPGVAMRSTQPGRVVGMAMEDFAPDPADGTTTGSILAFVNPGWSLGNLTEEGDIASSSWAVVTTTGSGGGSGSGSGGGVLDQFTLYIKYALQKLGLAIANGIATVQQLFADKVTTNELCIKDVCVTRDQLAQLLANANNGSSNSGGAGAGSSGSNTLTSPANITTGGVLGISFAAPTAGTTASGTVELGVNITLITSTTVSRVDYQVDGADLGQGLWTNNPEYSYNWNTGTVTDGDHEVTATITDSTGATSTATMTVSVDNGGASADESATSSTVATSTVVSTTTDSGAAASSTATSTVSDTSVASTTSDASAASSTDTTNTTDTTATTTP